MILVTSMSSTTEPLVPTLIYNIVLSVVVSVAVGDVVAVIVASSDIVVGNGSSVDSSDKFPVDKCMYTC